MKDELNFSYNGGGVVYVLKSELSRSSMQYIIFEEHLGAMLFARKISKNINTF